MNNQQPLFIGSVAEVAAWLHCHRSTLWRRMNDRPECFRRLGRSIIAVISL